MHDNTTLTLLRPDDFTFICVTVRRFLRSLRSRQGSLAVRW